MPVPIVAAETFTNDAGIGLDFVAALNGTVCSCAQNERFRMHPDGQKVLDEQQMHP